MKKILYFFVLFFFLFSCKRDYEFDAKATIVGTWQPTKFRFTTTIAGFPVTKEMDANACQLQSRAVYNTDLTGVESRFEENSGNCEKLYERNVTYKYDVGNRTLTTSFDGGGKSVEVASITQNTLIIKTQREVDGYLGDLEITNIRLK